MLKLRVKKKALHTVLTVFMLNAEFFLSLNCFCIHYNITSLRQHTLGALVLSPLYSICALGAFVEARAVF